MELPGVGIIVPQSAESAGPTGPTGPMGPASTVPGPTGPTGPAAVTTNLGRVTENVNILGNVGTDTVIDLTLGNVVSLTLTGAAQLSFSSVAPAGKSSTVTLWITNGSAYALTWSPALKWAGGSAPTLSAAGLDIIVLTTIDGGATWCATAQVGMA